MIDIYIQKTLPTTPMNRLKILYCESVLAKARKNASTNMQVVILLERFDEEIFEIQIMFNIESGS